MSDEKLKQDIGEPDYWTCDFDSEELTTTEQDDAIESYLDLFWPPAYEYKGEELRLIAAFLDSLPEKITVYGWTRRTLEPSDPDPSVVLDRVMEELDDEYGGDEPSGSTSEMLEAASVFVEAIRKDYKVWQC